MYPTIPTRNPDILYNKAITAIAELLRAVQADAEPDMDEILLLKYVIKMLQSEKLEQHENYQRKIQMQSYSGGNY